jgi:hypothetical protein
MNEDMEDEGIAVSLNHGLTSFNPSPQLDKGDLLANSGSLGAV